MEDHYKLMKQVLDTVAQNGGFDSDDALMRRLSREQGFGTVGGQFHDLLGGFNRGQQGNPLPTNTDMQGLTFFTRPNLNLTYDNVMAYRQLSVLASKVPASYSRVIRRMLWPDGKFSDIAGDKTLFDNRNAFMPLLSNSITSMSGWPDMTLHAYSSNEGMAKEVWMMNDSIAEINGRFDLDCTFENTLGDPISLTFFAWLLYIGGVYMGTKIRPAGYSILQNEMDYNTRVYRFLMDWSGQYIQKWATCGAAFPVGLSIGSQFNFNRDTPYSEANKSIQIPFACTVAEYNDPVSLWEFNKVTLMHNPDMGDDVREDRMQKVTPQERKLLNYRGFPWINLQKNNELEWWVDNDIYIDYTKGQLDGDTVSRAARLNTTVGGA